MDTIDMFLLMYSVCFGVFVSLRITKKFEYLILTSTALSCVAFIGVKGLVELCIAITKSLLV